MNKGIYITLMASLVGNQFYILFASVVLLDLGYSSQAVGGFIAITIIPNLIFGPWLGRVVDRHHKKRLHTILCFAAALVLLLLDLATKAVSVATGLFVVPLIMVAYNFIFSPLNTILYQYVIPTLDLDERLSYNRWERYQASGMIFASLLSFFIIKAGWVAVLLWIDAVTFVLAAVVIHKSWDGPQPSAEETLAATPAKRKLSFAAILHPAFSFSVLGFGIVACVTFVFSVDSHAYSTGVLFLKELAVPMESIPLVTGLLGIFNFLGTSFYQKFLSKIDSAKIQCFAHLQLGVALALMAVGLSVNHLWLPLLGLVVLQMVEPIWSTTNTVLLRTQVQPKRYGEFFGYFRILRSVVTAAGIALYGWAQTGLLLDKLVWAHCFIILLPLLFYGSLRRAKVEVVSG